VHNSIIFRHPYDPKKGPQASIDLTKTYLVKGDFGNFVQAETTIGSLVVPTLDFDKPALGFPEPYDKGGTWSVRHYFVFYGTLAYVVSFGTTEWNAMFRSDRSNSEKLCRGRRGDIFVAGTVTLGRRIPLTEVPKLGAVPHRSGRGGATSFNDAALDEVRRILSSHVLTIEPSHCRA
jgi:hypothetical protein